jgi:protein phosphatase
MAERRDDSSFDFDEGEIAGAQTLPGALPCPACKALSVGTFCTGCGFELLPVVENRAAWPALGARLEEGAHALTLKAALSAPPGEARWIALDQDGARWEVIGIPRTESLDGPRAEARDAGRALLGDYALPYAFVVSTPTARLFATQLPNVSSVADGLASLLADRSGVDLVFGVERWVLPVARVLADLHGRGIALGGLDPAEVLVDEAGKVHFRGLPDAWRVTEERRPATRRRAVRGYSSPELLGHAGGEINARTDVFAVGAILYYALTRVAPLAEAGLSGERLPPPQVYQPNVPPELAAVARRACSPLAARRYPDGAAFLVALTSALDDHTRRRNARWQRLQIDIGHELHIGVLKGQYSPVNQDDLFLAFDPPSAIGLFLISDGVSISEYGTGDMASACVRAETTEFWRRLCTPAASGDDDAPLPSAPTQPGAGPNAPGPTLPAGLEARERILTEVLDAANHRIAELIHDELPRFPGPPEGIMAATAVGALLDGNRALLFSIGDSRIYLIRNGHISGLMIDDDLTTQLLRLGRAPSVARAVPAGGALIRCVGEFEKGENDRLVPVPLQPGFRELVVLPGDRLVICSDGVPDYAGVDEEDAEENIRRVVEQASGAPWAAFELMVLANRGGGGDNISCIVLSFGPGVAAVAETDPNLPAGGAQ